MQTGSPPHSAGTADFVAFEGTQNVEVQRSMMGGAATPRHRIQTPIAGSSTSFVDAHNESAITRFASVPGHSISALTGCPISLTKRSVEACHQTPGMGG